MPEPKWSGRNPQPDGGGPGGASSLTDLTDVTGTPSPGTAPVYDDTGTAPLTPVTTQADLDNILVQVANIEYHQIGDPNEPPFQNGFRNYGEPWAPARYRHAANNVVHIDGVISRTDRLTEPTVIFVLPEGHRPNAGQVFAMASENGVSRVDVLPDGTVEWRQYLAGTDFAEVYLSLSGIKFNAT